MADAHVDLRPETASDAAALALKEDKSAKGAASGYAPLDSGSKVPVANLPAASGAAAGTQSAADYSKLAALPSAANTGMNVEVANDVDPSVAPGLASITINGVVVPLRIGDKAHTVNLAHSYVKTGTAATDWTSIDVTVAATLAAMEDVMTERAAGARGMVHLTALDWAPTVTAASHLFALPTTGYDEFLLLVKNAGGTGGGGGTMTLDWDGAAGGSAGELHGYVYNADLGGSTVDLIAPYWALCCQTPGGKVTGEIRIRMPASGGAVVIETKSGMYTAADNYAYARSIHVGAVWTTGLSLGSFIGSQYVGNVTTVEVWGRPTPT